MTDGMPGLAGRQNLNDSAREWISRRAFETAAGKAGATQTRTETGAANRTGTQDTDRIPQSVRDAASDFEAVFISQMMAPMFEGLETNGYFGGGQAESKYRSLLVDEIGKSVAGRGGLGIADQVAREMMKMQEG